MENVMRAVIMTRPGGCEVLELVDRPEPEAAPGQALVKVAFAGVNFMDTGVRRGLLWAGTSNPKILGVEGSGVVLTVGQGVENVRPGQRVAWAYAPGSYAERLAVSAAALVPVPDEIDDWTAAAIMLQGLTASHFSTDFYPINPGDIALVHAAAGGIGQLLTQLIKLRGGVVIGRVSHKDKAAAAKEAGADHVVVNVDGDFAETVIQMAGGEGVHVVYDGSGPETFKGSLASLRRCGTLCWFGPVLGGPGKIDLMTLPKSIKIGYPNFLDHIHTPSLLRTNAQRLFELVKAGALVVRSGGVYSLSEVAKAHADVESRATMGKLLIGI
jgi:NADPH2:quinone reductase